MYLKLERGKKCSQSFLDNLVQLERVGPKDGDIMYAEYKLYVENVVPKNRQLLLKFSKHPDRLMSFFSNVWGLDDYSQLKRVTKMILVLIHDQA